MTEESEREQERKRRKLAKHRELERERNEERRKSGRNIGEIPDVIDPDRRERCKHDLAEFIMTYSGEQMLPFSPDHFRVIARIEDAVFHGGRFVEAVYRGFGKTTMSEMSAIWAAVNGHKRFIVIVAANGTMGEDIMESIKGIMMSDTLLYDFPEVCYPILELDGITQRAHGQMYQGELTDIEWTKEDIKFPTIPDSPSSGTIITSRGILSSKLRGMRKYNKDGSRLRPDYIVIDDPQTEQSAATEGQVNKRLNVINKALLKSTSHQNKVSVVMPCTVIEIDDVVDQLLDHNRNPSWQGERIPMVTQWSDIHDEFWMTEYAEERKGYDPTIPGDQLAAHERANKMYEAKRKEADAGCMVSWDHCYSPALEVSSIQHAYNALIDDGEAVFASEYQNQPLIDDAEFSQLTTEQVFSKVTDRNRGHFSDKLEKITCFVDVQKTCFYWVVCAFGAGFDGHILDYGCFPDQQMNYWELRGVRHTIQKIYAGAGQEGCWRAGLTELTKILLGTDYIRDDGSRMRINRILIDVNDGNAAQTVMDFVQESPHKAIITPSRGRGVTASQTPFSDYTKKRGDLLGMNWRVPAGSSKKSVRYVIADVNFWKSFVRTRFQTPLGDHGSLTLFKHASEVTTKMFADHMVSEFSVRTEGRGRSVDEWKARPNTENHWFDCMVGCHIAASMEGVTLRDVVSAKKRSKAKVSFAQMQASARGGR